MTTVLQGKEAVKSIAYTFVGETIDNLIALRKMFNNADCPEQAKQVGEACAILAKLYVEKR